MALIEITEQFIKENPNIFYVLECYFSQVDEIKQEKGVITYRVQGDGIPDNDILLDIKFNNENVFLQLIYEPEK